MKQLVDPPRLFESESGAPDDVRALLAFAQNDMLTSEASTRVVEAALVTTAASGVAAGGVLGLMKSFAKLGLAIKLSLVSVLSVGVGVGVWTAIGHEREAAPVAMVRSAPKRKVQVAQVEAVAPVQAPVQVVAPVLEQAASAPVEAARTRSKKHGRRGAAERQMEGAPSPEPSPEGRESKEEVSEVVPPTPPPAAPVSRVEVQMLRAAREALQKTPARTLSLVEQHAAQFPASILAEERDALAVEALLGLGRKSQARTAAQRFFARYPSSPLRARVRAGVNKLEAGSP